MLVRLSIRTLIALALVFVWAGAGSAQTGRSITGTAQFFIGNGLPIPHPAFGGARPATTMGNGSGTTPMGGGPAGGQIIAGVFTQGAFPQTITVKPSAFKHDGAGFNQPVLFANPNVFQVYTDLELIWPKRTTGAGVVGVPDATNGGAAQNVVFQANGRTGPAVVNFCPGTTGVWLCPTPALPAVPNVSIPLCTAASCPGPLTPTIVPGHLRYTNLANQFGGPGRGGVGGTFNIALVGGGGAVAAFVGGYPNPTGAAGASFGNFNQNNPPPLYVYPVTMTTGMGAITGYIPFKVTTLGGVTATPTMMGATALAPGNTSTASFGGPWTTGRLRISQPAAVPAEIFTITGTDLRNTVTGGGSISLVSGAVSIRATTGPNANRGLLTMVVPEPMAIAGTAAALGMLVGCHQLVRRRRNG